MKKLFIIVLLVCGLVLFSTAEGINFKVFSYQISTRQTANQYTKAELIIDDGTMSWEIILHRKDGKTSESIKLEQFDDIGRNNGVFRTVTITEAAGKSGSNLFAYMPVFEGNKIRVDLCDKRTEGTKRRLIMEY
ncbi:MAG: hypothetical protein FWG07_10470 [Treponema sp.]|nr:hypothetical protein [Treponema sp.]